MKRILIVLAAVCMILGFAPAPANAFGVLYRYKACINHRSEPITWQVKVCFTSDIRRQSDGIGFEIYRSEAWVDVKYGDYPCDPGAWENPALDDTYHSMEGQTGGARSYFYNNPGPDLVRDGHLCEHVYNYPNAPGEKISTNYAEVWVRYAFDARLNNWPDFTSGLNIHVWMNGDGVGYNCFSPDGVDVCDRSNT